MHLRILLFFCVQSLLNASRLPFYLDTTAGSRLLASTTVVLLTWTLFLHHLSLTPGSGFLVRSLQNPPQLRPAPCAPPVSLWCCCHSEDKDKTTCSVEEFCQLISHRVIRQTYDIDHLQVIASKRSPTWIDFASALVGLVEAEIKPL